MDSSNSESDSMDALTPTELKEASKSIVNNVLPEKSREKYIKAYENFISWRYDKKTKSFSETVLVAYFDELSKTLKPSTLWGIYSMLKATICTEDNINIKTYKGLTTFLKRLSCGFKSKKSKVLSAENVEAFLREAPDEHYLATKVVLIFGVNGACRTSELINIQTNDIENYNDMILIKLRNTKIDRTFIIRDEFLDIVKKYQNLRPKNVKNDRFFLNYFNGKCTRQPIGRHKFDTLPRTIATYLKLPNAESYTGHCFRRTSATLLADSGANLTTLKRHGGWTSDKVAEGYIEDSVENKVKVNYKLNESINLRQSTSTEATTSREAETVRPQSPCLGGRPMTEENFRQLTAMTRNTNINVPGKNISLSFHNCPNANIKITFK